MSKQGTDKMKAPHAHLLLLMALDDNAFSFSVLIYTAVPLPTRGSCKDFKFLEDASRVGEQDTKYKSRAIWLEQ